MFFNDKKLKGDIMARSTVYNGDIVTKEKLSLVNKKNKRLLKDFIEYLHSIDRAVLTIKNYTSDINIVFCWNLKENDNKFFILWSKRDIIKFQNYMLTEMALSSGRVRRLRSALSSLSIYIENILDDEFENFRNIINKIPAPINTPIREKTVFSESQLKHLLDYLVEKQEYQKVCLLALSAYSGCRKAELLRMKEWYFTDENIILNSLFKTPEKITTKGRGKLGKLIYKYCLSEEFKPFLNLWLNQRKELGVDSEWLFVTKSGEKWKQMSISTPDSWAIQFSKIADVDFYWHSMRHYFTTYLSTNKKLPDKVIKSLSGWENLEMVLLYTDTDIEDELGEYFN